MIAVSGCASEPKVIMVTKIECVGEVIIPKPKDIDIMSDYLFNKIDEHNAAVEACKDKR